jgi:hypothetical protein
MKVESRETEKNNFLLNINEGKYVFYMSSQKEILREVDAEEWDWSQEWGVSTFVLPYCSDIQKIVTNIEENRVKNREILEKGINLEIGEKGHNEFEEIYKTLDEFVIGNFNELWEGARRIEDEISEVHTIDEDYYAPRRIQVNETRLHYTQGLKYADGVKCSEYYLTEEDIIKTCEDLKILIDAYNKDIKTNLKITVSS